MQVDFNQTLVVEISEPTHHRVDFNDLVIVFQVICGCFIELLGEFELPSFLVMKCFTDSELWLAADGKVSVLFDDLLNVGSEFIVGVKLLLNETVLFEVFIEHVPQVVLLDFTTHH